ncbi:MAG: gamma-glutamyl-gamma-aminobutyrate hydrolase family protein [Firmicutes bacterium]|nr:gamma-glutamyl-gamma-aminobutyrate hydrolase family protein [Bacillota bacterium]
MDRKPIILITAEDINNATGNVYIMNKEYGNAVREAGGIPAAACNYKGIAEYAELGDALIICDGPQMHPARYGGLADRPDDLMGFSQTRDDFDFGILDAFVKAGKPVLGINRGALVINAYFGGKIAKGIPPRMIVGGKMMDSPMGGYSETAATWSVYNHTYGTQKLSVEAGSRLEKYVPDGSVVNTFQTQAVKDLAPCLKLMAKSEDGVIEAFEHESLPVIGIQWNPEHPCEGYTPDGAVYRMFVDMVKEGK